MTVDKEKFLYILKTEGIKATYRRMITAGYTKEDAGNTVAKFLGIREIPQGWTVRELQYLMFFKVLNDKSPMEEIREKDDTITSP